MRVLVLGGTAEGRRLADVLAADPAVDVVSSLAGRTAEPRLPAGLVRTGGFGGPEGLAAWLLEQRVDAVIDATHPFARTVTANAAAAAAAVHVPLLVLRRPGWVAGPGDAWHWAGSVAQAARLVPSLGRRVLLTTGRGEAAAFAGVSGVWFLARSVEPPDPPPPAHVRVLLARGPFTVEGERELLAGHRIDAVVTKDSGGEATAAKLTAARELGLPVLLVRRPPLPPGVPAAEDVAGAVRWLRGL
ncbi:cobalt-precorrin-6A reductase [Streptomyces sp. NPDC001380]|uniref:cobalt-precorrin-6A reductase n=1 Tax=Streptomyces sp. NPDC001380 TaxID=3364566 RepID=UPI003694F2E9